MGRFGSLYINLQSAMILEIVTCIIEFEAHMAAENTLLCRNFSSQKRISICQKSIRFPIKIATYFNP